MSTTQQIKKLCGATAVTSHTGNKPSGYITKRFMHNHHVTCTEDLPLHLGGPGDRTTTLVITSRSHSNVLLRTHMISALVRPQSRLAVCTPGRCSQPHLVCGTHFWRPPRLLSSRWSRRWLWTSPCPSAGPRRCRTCRRGSSDPGPSCSPGRRRGTKG